MKAQNRIAFKEWAVIIQAITQKKQSIILRKGGIHEKKGRFQVEHEEFFLFPTYEHQNKADLKSSVHADLARLQELYKSPQEISIECFVEVKKVVRVTSLNRLKNIYDFHVWSEQAVEKRFNYGEEKGLFLLLVKPFKLAHQHLISNLNRYAGCKSWVELAEPLSTDGSISLVTNQELASLSAMIDKSLTSGAP